MSRKIAVLGGLLAAAIVALVLFLIFHGGSSSHKATCWKPAYASAPTVIWARNPSVTHRHGAGPRGSDVCDKGAK